MLRVSSSLLGAAVKSLKPSSSAAIFSKRFSHGKEESPEEFDQRFVDYFNRPDIDGWEVRKAMTELQNYDVIPEPKIVSAALRACRRVNDFALSVRFLESIKIKCGTKKNVQTIYPYILQEVKPVLDELGISTPEALGYDKPELFIPQPEYWWEHKWYKDYGYDKKPGYEF